MKFTRDNIIWALGFYGGVIAFVASSTHLIPADYQQTVMEASAVMAFIAGKLGNSPLLGDGGK